MRIKNFRKRFMGVLLLWLSILLVVSPSYAAKKLEEIISPEAQLSKPLPKCQIFSGTHYSARRNYDYTFNASSKTDPETGEVHFQFSSPAYEIQATLDSALRLEKAVYKNKNKDSINKHKHDQRIITLDPETKDQITVEFFLEGKSVKQKQIDYDYFTLYLGVAHVTLQALLLNGIQDFNCDVILPDKAWRLNVDFKLIKSSDPPSLSPQYVFPEKFKEIVKSNAEYLVYEATVKGTIGFFYKHKYYLVYKAEKPHDFVAYWGGDPERVEFIFTDGKVQEPASEASSE